MAVKQPVIYVLAGVNGSGKSSVAGATFRAKGVEYYNPDEVARRFLDDNPSASQSMANSHAWALGKALLENAISNKATYAFETTLGGQTIPALLIEAAKRGAHVKIWYVGLESVELNIERVHQRVQQGGHPISEEKIRERWDGSRRNLIRLLPYVHSLRLFDNSWQADPREGQQPQPMLLLDVGAQKILGPGDLSRTPEWAKPIVAAAISTNGQV
ncbi:zeta toxin family protein [Ruficoccus amylovorans]|uniref:Zeta toxin family protein n=1 Tax=Ruficoccus amylovorans TaxID=1804625 RepID=A0A842HBH7_9BACT|nr:zeta toxin family protein [Ruficoccus amylovorans]MBC2593509.1 zeta toxin family protein [Ruficoccus amylovorans]